MQYFSRMYCVVDLETTGGSPSTDRITEIAMILHDGTRVVDRWSSLVNPERPIPSHITRITGITDEMVADAPKFFEIARKVVEFSENAVFVAHNARFDYSFLRKEFADLGYSYRREALCSVKLSRQAFPGLPSYSLGKLCRGLGIALKNRHRALGDAEATARLLGRILEEAPEAVERGRDRGWLPEGVTAARIDSLPSKAGVYFLHERHGSVIYVGKSKNIRKRVKGHLRPDAAGGKPVEFKDEIHDITYLETGSEMLALIVESAKIKALRPKYNRALRSTRALYGVFVCDAPDGYPRLRIKTLPHMDEPLLVFSGRRAAVRAVERLAEEHGLCLRYCFERRFTRRCGEYFHEACSGACSGGRTAGEYRDRVAAMAARYRYPEPDFVLLDEGRSPGERSYVCVEAGVFVGYGYLKASTLGRLQGAALAAELRRGLVPVPEDRDSRRTVISAYRHASPGSVLRLASRRRGGQDAQLELGLST